MPKPKMQPKRTKPFIITAWIVGGIVGFIVFVVILLYAWPLGSDKLQSAVANPLNYQQAIARQADIVAAETKDGVKDACHSLLLTHGQKTAKAVVMFHGYTSCPGQFKDLAQFFYAAGYNVYVPLAPQHGRKNAVAESFKSEDLVQYANDSLNLTQGLGDDVGAAGLSGGAVLATWLAEYRTDIVKHLLVLSPFYETSPSDIPKWMLKPFLVLYGYNILSDKSTDNSLHYRSLAQYLRIVANFKDKPASPTLNNISAVISLGDKVVDHQRAHDIVQTIGDTNAFESQFYEPPLVWGLGHDIVGNQDNKDINGHAADLYPIYLNLYEGNDSE